MSLLDQLTRTVNQHSNAVTVNNNNLKTVTSSMEAFSSRVGIVTQAFNRVSDTLSKFGVFAATVDQLTRAQNEQKKYGNLLGTTAKEMDRWSMRLGHQANFFQRFGMDAEKAMDLSGGLSHIEKFYDRVSELEDISSKDRIDAIEYGNSELAQSMGDSLIEGFSGFSDKVKKSVDGISDSAVSKVARILTLGASDGAQIAWNLATSVSEAKKEAKEAISGYDAIVKANETAKHAVMETYGNLHELYGFQNDQILALHNNIMGVLKLDYGKEERITAVITNAMNAGLRPAETMKVIQENSEKFLLADSRSRHTAVKTMLEAAVIQKRAGVDFGKYVSDIPKPEDQIEEAAIISATSGTSLNKVLELMMRAEMQDSKAIMELNDLKLKTAQVGTGATGYNRDIERMLRGGATKEDIARRGYKTEDIDKHFLARVTQSIVLKDLNVGGIRNVDESNLLQQQQDNIKEVMRSFQDTSESVKKSLTAISHSSSVSGREFYQSEAGKKSLDKLMEISAEAKGKGKELKQDDKVMAAIDAFSKKADIPKDILLDSLNRFKYSTSLSERINSSDLAEKRGRLASTDQIDNALAAKGKAAAMDAAGEGWVDMSNSLKQVKLSLDRLAGALDTAASLVPAGKMGKMVGSVRDGILDMERGNVYNIDSEDKLMAYRPGGPVENTLMPKASLTKVQRSRQLGDDTRFQKTPPQPTVTEKPRDGENVAMHLVDANSKLDELISLLRDNLILQKTLGVRDSLRA